MSAIELASAWLATISAATSDWTLPRETGQIKADLCRPQARYGYQSRGLDTGMRETFGYAVTQAVTYIRELSDSNHFPQSVLDAIRRARRPDLNDQVIALDSEGPKLVFAD